MASNPIPSVFFGAGYTETGTGATHTIVLTTNDNSGTKLLPELTEVEADPTTGDYRKILFALMEMMYVKYQAVTPVPGKLTLTRSSFEDTASGELVRTYTVQIRTNVTGVEVADEA
jgi:hypothetical protein